MKANDAMRHIIKKSGSSQRQVSRDLGRADTYISARLVTGAEPSCALMSDIARACGYSLQLVGHGETLTLDGTSEADTQADAKAD